VTVTEALITGTGESPYVRTPPPDRGTPEFLADAVRRALEDGGIAPSDVDGLAVSSFSLAPDHAIDLAWRLGLSLRWIMQDTNGGASGLNMLAHARRAVEAGDAQAVVIVSGDAQGPAEIAQRQARFNRATETHLAPIGYGGPNSLFAMLTLRQMASFGLERADYGCVAIAQRRWAAGNPGAVYRDPLTLEEYLSAPLVADPLRRYDCVPGVAGADALLVTAAEGSHRPPLPRVRIRALASAFNHDQQEGSGLRTGLSTFASQLWSHAGTEPEEMDLACIYDDYPAMVLAQLADLGFVADGDLQRFARTAIGERRLAVNTSGGLLSAGQAGAAGGMHGLVEAVRQLRGQAGERQVPGARLAVATGYGMILYRFGAAAAAAVLEREP
jgi:acetyl-CoA acetyltransferase